MNILLEFLLELYFGIKDSFRGIILITSIDNEEKRNHDIVDRPSSRRSTRPTSSRKRLKVLPMLLRCCLLNGGVLLSSVMLFEYYIVPGVKWLVSYFGEICLNGNAPRQLFVSIWLEFLMNNLFKYLWVVPLFWLCKVLNCIWFVEIADAAYRRIKGRPVSLLLSSKESIFQVVSKTMADLVFSVQVELFFLLQAQLIGLLPVFGPTLSLIHMSLLYSLYAFEYTWTNLGWNVVKRINFIENNWPYFVGFGLILAFITSVLSSTVISACVFGILFPVFILSGLDAKPQENCKHPVRLFSVSIWLTNQLFLFKSTKPKQAS